MNLLNGSRQENIADYIRWRGDLSFAQVPLGLIDNLIFCELSYVDFSPVLPPDDDRGITLAECGRLIEQKGVYCLRNLYGGQEDFFRAVCQSRRYGSVLLCHYADVFDAGEQVQFSAVEFRYGHRQSYIAFRGTDNSIIGWKEDFMISFTRIKAQEYAREYLKRVMKWGWSYQIGGHSKGGNLALFACAWLTPSQLRQVRRIYDNDGPGFCPENFSLPRLAPLRSLVTRIIPEFCIIGKIFEVTFPDTYIVKSKDSGVNQHDLISWLVDGTQLQTAPQNDRFSEWINKTIAEWVSNASFEERRTFVNEFFAALASGGAKTMQEVTGKGLLEVIKSMAAASPTSRKMVADLAAFALLGEKKNSEA